MKQILLRGKSAILPLYNLSFGMLCWKDVYSRLSFEKFYTIKISYTGNYTSFLWMNRHIWLKIQLQPHIKEAYRVLYNNSTKNELCVLDIPFIKLRSDSRCYYRDITSRCNSFDAIMKRVVHIGQKNHVYITLNNDKVDQM